MNSPDNEERARLETCLQSIDDNLYGIGERLKAYAKEIQETNDYMWEARRDLDHIDKVAMRQAIDQKVRQAEVLRSQQQKLRKLRKSPYFGRFDFARADRDGTDAIYVGVHDFRDEESATTMVHDWRAPVSSMFYDHEPGPAFYEAPSGTVSGEMRFKRQFRIRDGHMEFMLESGLNIVDEVLQEELSRSSDEGMKNIVATIQRDQNAIIRNADAHTLIIQGVAGSGKTSIALHRIAFLLYRFKDTLTSNDMLIISPNRVFADYIGNVLPELGEEQVGEIGMETLADELLDHKFRFQTFFEQTAQLTEKDDEALQERIAFKSSLDLLQRLDAYVEKVEAESFVAEHWGTGTRVVPDVFFADAWKKYAGLSHGQRIGQVVATAEHKIGLYYNYDLRTDERRAMREAVSAMARKTTLREAYRKFFEWVGKPEFFKPAGGKLEYADVFPLIYLKMNLEGVDNARKDVRHLLIDEMQDYTPVQYAVIGKLFSCRKTILGDASQSVSPFGGSNADSIRRVLKASAPVKLTKSYRSTWEIMQFALSISPNDELVPMERHGETPRVVTCKKPSEELDCLVEELRDFGASAHESLAIITKTQKQADKLHRQLAAAEMEVRLLDSTSTGFSTGAVICAAHLAKGLEFDRVVVPDVSQKNYRSALDRNLLYVACTRAMHRLTLTVIGEASPFLDKVLREPAG